VELFFLFREIKKKSFPEFPGPRDIFISIFETYSIIEMKNEEKGVSAKNLYLLSVPTFTSRGPLSSLLTSLA
jgi:hypothetical protein